MPEDVLCVCAAWHPAWRVGNYFGEKGRENYRFLRRNGHTHNLCCNRVGIYYGRKTPDKECISGRTRYIGE